MLTVIFSVLKLASYVEEELREEYAAKVWAPYQQYLSNSVPSEPRSCVKVEVDVLGSLSLIVRTVSVGVKQHWNMASELRSCVKVEVAVLGSLSLTVRKISGRKATLEHSVRTPQGCVKVGVDVLGSP